MKLISQWKFIKNNYRLNFNSLFNNFIKLP